MEKWKPISFNPMYEVSSHGRIRNAKKGLVLKQQINSVGYPYLILYNYQDKSLPKPYKMHLVHRLVALAFVENECPEKYNQVNHDDTCKTNNHESNLQWTDNSGNGLHSFKNGRKPSMLGENHRDAKLKEADVIHIWNNNLRVKEVMVTYGLSYSGAWKVVHKLSWKHLIQPQVVETTSEVHTKGAGQPASEVK